MILREMTVEDLEQVMEIEQDLFAVPWNREGYFTYLTKENVMLLVVEDKETVVGFAGLLMVLDEGEVLKVAVKKERQREGIGGFLMDGMLRLAKEQGIHTIHLEVRTKNESAIRLYERAGFGRDGIRKNYYTQIHEDALLMTRKE